GFAGEFLEAQLPARVAFREILLVRSEAELAVRQERPAVVLADEAFRAALRPVHQRIAAVLADVVERLHATVLLTDHQDRLRTYFLELPVAWIRQLGLAPEQQPDLGPHVFPFPLEEL